MNKLLIVTCTKAKSDKEFTLRPIYSSLQKQYEINSSVEFYIFKDNNRGLSERYNEIINNPKHINKTVLFVHDDVLLEDLFLYEKLTTSPYSITGIAGTKTFNKASDKLAWHLASDRSNYVGEAAHIKDNRIWTTVFGPTTSRALIVDGLFISCKVKDLVENSLTFDENFKFHFYDIAFCLRANEKKLTCGVLPIRVIHHGLGDSMLTTEWEQANLNFKKSYCQ